MSSPNCPSWNAFCTGFRGTWPNTLPTVRGHRAGLPIPYGYLATTSQSHTDHTDGTEGELGFGEGAGEAQW